MRLPALVALIALIAACLVPAYADDAAKPADVATPPEATLMFGGGGPDAKRAVFVFAQGGDAALNTKIVLSLAHRLQRAHLFSKTSFVVPEGTWTTGQFLHQCDVDSDGTRGAVIVLPATNYTATENYVIMARSHTDVIFEIMIATCARSPEASVPGTVRVVWVSDTVYGKGSRTSVEFFPLTVLASLYLAFAPSKTYSSAATTVYPTSAPIPASGNIASVTNTSTASTNANGSGFIPSLISAFGVGSSSATFGQLPSNDSQAWFAADRASSNVLVQLGSACKSTNEADAAGESASNGRPAFCNW